MKKKVWSKPSLVVLVRAKPEETVLVYCKYDLVPEVSGEPFFANCNHMLAPEPPTCSNCFANLVS